MNVLALNAGSSSLKAALFEGEQCLGRHEAGTVADPGSALDDVEKALGQPDAVGHRLVHGGPDHAAPLRLDAAARKALGALEQYAPLHLPVELALVDASMKRWPRAPQVACFDTAFHHDLPAVAQRLPLPSALALSGVRRYGFHGLSYEYVVETLGAEALGRAVIAHLGSGASMVAVRGGRSIDTTMGFTPAGGLVMGTRTGDLDPGVLVHLLERHGYGARELDKLVNHDAGLRGISGTTSDMKELLEASARDGDAALAVDIFCMSARKHAAALVAVLGGVDTLVFTGGIGARSAPIRARISDGLAHLGVLLDPGANDRGDANIQATGASPRVVVIKTDEEKMIARHTSRALAGSGSEPNERA